MEGGKGISWGGGGCRAVVPQEFLGRSPCVSVRVSCAGAAGLHFLGLILPGPGVAKTTRVQRASAVL